MIQRIQSVYIAIATFLSSTMLFGKIASFVPADGGMLELRYNGLFSLMTAGAWQRSEGLLILSIVLIALPLLSLLSLLLFKFRKLQIRVSVLTLLLFIGETVMLGYFLYYIKVKYDTSIIFSIKTVFPLVASVLMYLAFRGILRDELLLKSFDRLR